MKAPGVIKGVSRYLSPAIFCWNKHIIQEFHFSFWEMPPKQFDVVTLRWLHRRQGIRKRRKKKSRNPRFFCNARSSASWWIKASRWRIFMTTYKNFLLVKPWLWEHSWTKKRSGRTTSSQYQMVELVESSSSLSNTLEQRPCSRRVALIVSASSVRLMAFLSLRFQDIWNGLECIIANHTECQTFSLKIRRIKE